MSKDDLKINGTASLEKISFNAAAIFRLWSRDSMTQGPAMTGIPWEPKTTLSTVIVIVSCCGSQLLLQNHEIEGGHGLRGFLARDGIDLPQTRDDQTTQ